MAAVIRQFIRRVFERFVGGRVRRETSSTAESHGEIDVAAYDVADVRAAVPEWDELDDAKKVAALQEADVDPVAEDHQSNAVNDDWHKYLVDRLDQGQDPATVDCSHFAVGTGTSSPTSGDSGLDNEVYRTTVASTSDSTRNLDVTCFLDSTEANGNTLEEMGLFTGAAGTGELQLNRALISSVVKDDTKLVTIDATLKFRSG